MNGGQKWEGMNSQWAAFMPNPAIIQMGETAKKYSVWHMALQLPYVPVFTKIGTDIYDGQR